MTRLRRGVWLRKLALFFFEADVGVTQSFELFLDDILIECGIRGYRYRIVDTNVKGVLPREVVQAAIVPTARFTEFSRGMWASSCHSFIYALQGG